MLQPSCTDCCLSACAYVHYVNFIFCKHWLEHNFSYSTITIATMNAALALFGLSVTATNAELNDAYRRVALVHHPDKGGDTEEFIKYQQAKDFIVQSWLSMRRPTPTPPPPPPTTPTAATNTCDIEQAISVVFQRRPGLPPSATTNESAFYTHLVNLIHAEVTWVGKKELKAVLYMQPWCSQCQAVWARVLQLKSTATPPPLATTPPPVRPSTPTSTATPPEPAAPPPPTRPPPSTSTATTTPPRLLFVNDGLPNLASCPGCQQWARHCMASHPNCLRR